MGCAASNSGYSAPAAFVIAEGTNSANTAVNLNRIVIKEGGNVGIGIDNPSAKLYVSGNTTVAGNLRIFGATNNLIVNIGAGDVSISATELTYLDGLTSNIQTQLNSKPDATNYYSKTDVDTTLSYKADSVWTTTQLSGKASLTSVDAKANKAAPALTGKLNIDDRFYLFDDLTIGQCHVNPVAHNFYVTTNSSPNGVMTPQLIVTSTGITAGTSINAGSGNIAGELKVGRLTRTVTSFMAKLATTTLYACGCCSSQAVYD